MGPLESVILVSVALVTAGKCLSDSHVKPLDMGLMSMVYLLVLDRQTFVGVIETKIIQASFGTSRTLSSGSIWANCFFLLSSRLIHIFMELEHETRYRNVAL